jgi:osmotically-inducible protein OsmY
VALELQQQLTTGQTVHVVDPQAIYIAASQGTIMLHGSVQDRNQIQQIERIARNVQGVQNVQNQLNAAGQQVIGQPAGQQQPMSASDRRLAQQVEQQLQQQLPDANINVTASQGTITLQGSVPQQNQKQQAERIAQSVSGVRNIRNNITVGEYPPLGFVPGQEDQAQQQETGISGDERCIQMLKQGLTDQNLRDTAQDIYVTCHEGEMALYGYVKSEDEKDQLERVTRQIQGITEVDNNLIVREEGWERKSDAEIQEDVESQLWWSPFVDSDNIEVSVQNGTVTLSGQVEDWDAEKAAIKNAFDGGAKRVRSQLQVQQETAVAGRQDRTGAQGQARNGQSGTY